jgi:DNA-binding CsgD family transcriptional regulator
MSARRPASGHNGSVTARNAPDRPGLYGREHEIEVLEAMLAAGTEHGEARVIRGDPGIGKSALLGSARAVAVARGFRVLTTTGVQSEAELPFAGLHQLLRPLPWTAEALPGPQREAVLAAFGRSNASVPDPFLIALATLELLADAASRSPLLVLAEDAQWLDRPTSNVLTFVARRVQADPIVMLFAVREGTGSAVLESGLNEMRLAPLVDTEAAKLLDAGAPSLTQLVRKHILDQARGNPLALVELPTARRSDAAGDVSIVPSNFQLTARLESAFSARFSDLPETTRTVLLVAALDDGSDLAEILSAASNLRNEAVTAAAVAPAEVARLIEVTGSQVHFRHQASVTGLRTQGRLGHLARALTMQGWSALCIANWRVAIPALDEAVRMAMETGEAAWAAGARAMQAIIAAVRGQPDVAAALSNEAEGSASSTGATHMLAYLYVARSLAALGAGRPDDAYQELLHIYDVRDPAHHRVPCCWYVGELAEAAAHSGRADEARALIQDLEPMVEGSRSLWIRSAFSYAHAQLANDADFERRLHEALALTNRWPFQRARLQLSHGAWLRRQRRIADARAPLRSARDAFDSIGTPAWAERARQELRAAGETSQGRSPDLWDQLSPQELQIASMAAEGLSNREIAQRLYLSPRTVGSHLYRVFPKLGISSRAQLGTAMPRPATTV